MTEFLGFVAQVLAALLAVGAFLKLMVVSPLKRWFGKNVKEPIETLKKSMEAVQKDVSAVQRGLQRLEKDRPKRE